MADYEGELIPSSEIDKLDFFYFSQKHKTSPVDFLIFDDLKEKGLIE
jgi:8-oxo-dGTP diphosphatase